MTHVVLESCIRCKYTDCVDVCPVECIIADVAHLETREQLITKYGVLTAEETS